MKKIFMTQETADLYSIIGKDPTIHFRTKKGGNIQILKYNQKFQYEDFEVELINSEHMLGSAQCFVEYNNGLKVGYSGDFSWPLEKVIEVDELVVDSTYGSEESVRNFEQDDAEQCLIELINVNLSKPIIIKGHRGTIHRMMQLISSCMPDIPILVSKKYFKEIEIYNKYNYNISNYYDMMSDEGIYIRNNNQCYIQFLLWRDAKPTYPLDFTYIRLSGFLSKYGPMVHQEGNNDYDVCITDHADHEGILDYIIESKAKFVLTDPSRTNYENAFKLARAIRVRLNIKSEPGEIN